MQTIGHDADPQMRDILSKLAPEAGATMPMASENDPTNAQEPTPTIALRIGNTVGPTTGDSVEWTVFVEPTASGAVAGVVWHLHPTFCPARVAMPARAGDELGAFRLTRRGWGTFTVYADVTLARDGSTHRLEHELTFDPEGASRVATLNVAAPAAAPETPVPAAAAAPAPAPAAEEDAQNVRRMTGVSAVGMHGTRGAALAAAEGGGGVWVAPRLVVWCDQEARPGYTSMLAHEYEDSPATLRAKVKALASLVRASSTWAAYTGAGISTASGIGDYASKAKNSIATKGKKKRSGFDAQPTLAHRVLAACARRGLLKEWVQQNHDGLPQKAGVPCQLLNEIHGAWYDPSNPVVPMSGSLRGDLCERLYAWEEKADLVLAMGTSLCGMNADRMVETPARKAREQGGASGFVPGGGCLGAVIVGLQRTQYDEASTLRIYAKCDDVMALLALELFGAAALRDGRTVAPPGTAYAPRVPPRARAGADKFRVPYDGTGRPTTVASEAKEGDAETGQAAAHQSPTTVWDLSAGARVRVTAGPGKGYTGRMLRGRTREGHYRVELPCQREGSKHQGKVKTVYVLGLWWVEAAAAGLAERLPIVNVR